jgi:hypothetical protein
MRPHQRLGHGQTQPSLWSLLNYGADTKRGDIQLTRDAPRHFPEVFPRFLTRLTVWVCVGYRENYCFDKAPSIHVPRVNPCEAITESANG